MDTIYGKQRKFVWITSNLDSKGDVTDKFTQFSVHRLPWLCLLVFNLGKRQYETNLVHKHSSWIAIVRKIVFVYFWRFLHRRNYAILLRFYVWQQTP